MGSPSNSIDPPPGRVGAVSAPKGRWKTDARIDALNRQASWSERRATQPSRYADLASGEAICSTAVTSGLAPVKVTEAINEPTRWINDDRVPSWLVSLVVHLGIVLLLALWALPNRANRGERASLVINSTAKDQDATLMQFEAIDPQPLETGEVELGPESLEAIDERVLETSLMNAPAELLASSAATKVGTAGQPNLGTPSQTVEMELALPIGGGALAERTSASRAAAVQRGETTAAAEDALELALRWLADHQHNDGGWSFRLEDAAGPCRGRCEHGRENPDDTPIPRTAATGLALLAFLGAGHTHERGTYAEQVRRGIYFLRDQASQTSLGLDLQNGSMYGHGIATLALAEAFVISEDEELRELIQGTTFFAAGAQHGTGGWGYLPGGPPDMTLTAWHVVALKTAELRGIRTPTQVIPKAREYVATLANPLRNRWGYRTPEPEVPTTAMGALLQLYFGALPNQTEMRDALDFLVAQGPSPTNVYYDYYAMLALHHSQHRDRKEFAEKLRSHLLETQAREGHQRGSWNFADRYGSVGGRLYTTAMCVLILETPYRHVPLYDPYRPFPL